MKTYNQFVNEIHYGNEGPVYPVKPYVAGHRPLDDLDMSPKNDLLELERIPNVKITNLQNVRLGGWMGKISVDGIEYDFDVYDNLGDWEYIIFDFPGSDVGTFPYDDRRGLQGEIEDIKDELEHYLGVK